MRSTFNINKFKEKKSYHEAYWHCAERNVGYNQPVSIVFTYYYLKEQKMVRQLLY